MARHNLSLGGKFRQEEAHFVKRNARSFSDLRIESLAMYFQVLQDFNHKGAMMTQFGHWRMAVNDYAADRGSRRAAEILNQGMTDGMESRLRLNGSLYQLR